MNDNCCSIMKHQPVDQSTRIAQLVRELYETWQDANTTLSFIEWMDTTKGLLRPMAVELLSTNSWMELTVQPSFYFLPASDFRRGRATKEAIVKDNRNDNPASKKPCHVEWCNNPRLVSSNGIIGTKCVQHARESSRKSWAKQAEKRKLQRRKPR